MVTAQWLISPVGTTFVVSRTMSSFNPLPFTTPFIPMTFLLVKDCAFAACSSPEVCPLVDLLNGLLWAG